MPAGAGGSRPCPLCRGQARPRLGRAPLSHRALAGALMGAQEPPPT